MWRGGRMAGWATLPWTGAVPSGLEPAQAGDIATARMRRRAARGRSFRRVGLAWALAYGVILAAAVAQGLVEPRLMLPTVLLGLLLVAVATIDSILMLLPDRLTLALAVAGFAATLLLYPLEAPRHVLAACVGYALLAAVGAAYEMLRGRAGLGGGDPKLLAAAGAWVGVEGLAHVLLLAAVSGVAFAVLRPSIVSYISGSRGSAAAGGATIEWTRRLSFGPHLALGLWIVWLFGALIHS